MARNYSNTPVLSKIKIGDTLYYLKDADARGILDSINDNVYAALQLDLGTVSGNDGKLVTAANIKSYVDSAIEALPEFDVVVVPSGQDLPTASADTWHKIYLKEASKSGVVGNVYQEYITIRAGAGTELDPYTYSWELIGDTAIDLSGYVSDVKYIANTHKLQQQKGNGNYEDVHQFGAMADVSQGTATVNDYVVGVSSAKVTAAGALQKDNDGVQISGSIGSITVIDSVGVAPSKAADTWQANTPTTLDLSKFSGGSKVADTWQANTPTALDLSKFSGGSKAADAFTAPSLVTTSKALYKQGITATVGSGSTAETLIISNVEKEADIDVVSSWNAGSFVEGAFTPASLASGFYTEGVAASFVEGAFSPAALASGFYSAGTAASFVEGAFDAGSLPTTKSVTPAFTGDKFKFVGSEVNASVVLSVGSKTITVDPKVE